MVRLVRRVAREMLVVRKSARQATSVLFGLSGESGPNAGSLAVRVRLSAAASVSTANPAISAARERTLRPKSASVPTENAHHGALGVIYHHAL